MQNQIVLYVQWYFVRSLNKKHDKNDKNNINIY